MGWVTIVFAGSAITHCLEGEWSQLGENTTACGREATGKAYYQGEELTCPLCLAIII